MCTIVAQFFHRLEEKEPGEAANSETQAVFDIRQVEKPEPVSVILRVTSGSLYNPTVYKYIKGKGGSGSNALEKQSLTSRTLKTERERDGKKYPAI